MLKDMHINYIRTHTFPHPKFMIDLADEMGILVCLESSWFMSGKQALDKDEFWDNAKVHARDNIRNYKNHPSVILWSTGNEVRWGWNIGEVIKHGPEIQKIYDEADPTRIAFSDGSTSLWDERSQLVISRHYGVECTGEEFWDKSKPLHVGEIGKWHYGQPIDNLVWGDDAIFGSFEKCATAIAEEGADIILQGRSNEVSCLFPWNISCLDNYRPSPKETRHDWQDFNTPYAKPTRTGAYVSEFAWWEPESKGYIPGAGFKLIQHANRPFAIYIREKLNQIFSNQEIIHTVSLINDLGKDITGILKVEAFIGNKKVYYHQIDAQVKNGKTSKTEIKIPQISVDRKENILVTTSFWNGKTLIDSVQRNFWITPALENSVKWDVGSWLVYGKGLVRNLLNKHGVQFRNIDKLDSLPLAKEKLLLIERNMIEAGSKQNKILREYMERGGRVFLMEQENNAMPSLTIESKPSERCFIRAYDHPLMGKFNADDFSYWGNAPYGKNNSESWVVIKPFIKPTSGNTTILLDCGYGDFGSGGLNWTPLFETKSGKGLLISSQLRLTDRMEVHPSAQKVVKEIMNYLNTTVLPKGQSVFALGDIDLKALENIGAKTGSEKDACVIIASGKDVLKSNISEKFKEKVTTGAIVFIHDLDSADIVNVSKQWNIEVAPVNLGPQYNLVRTADVGTLNGISNQETYWLDKAHYTPTTNKNTKITDWLMRTTQGKSLLESESQSCWREFYTLGAQSEWLRMPVVTHYLYNGPREHASAMLEFNIGKGKLILTQVPFPMDNYAKAEIFWAQLLTNYHITFKDNLFDGEKVANGSQKSNGYPESMKMIKNPDQNLAEQIISKGDPGETSERFTNQGLSQGFKWENIKTENGMLKLNNDCKEVFIYYELNPGRPRKLQEVTGGWPDPSQQTFIDLKGKGRLTLFVNGKKYQSIQLDGGTVSIADIDLNQAWNTILIHFEPSSPDFQMQWRNRQSRPEMEFMFK
jgi:hypothetical protein